MPPHVVEAAARAASGRRTRRRSARSTLREAIAEQLSGELGWPVDPERNVLVTLGGMQALYLAAQCFGARAVSHAPAFFFPQVVAAAGGECAVTGGAAGPPDWDAFAAAIDSETTLAIVNTPVNPTGYVFRRARPRRDRGRARAHRRAAALRRGVRGLLYDGREHVSPGSHPELRERTLVLRSFSKTHAMAAWRVGFAVGPGRCDRADGARRSRGRRSRSTASPRLRRSQR